MLSRTGSKKAPPAPLGPSLSAPAPRSPPSDPLPSNQPRPADVLIARLNELKRLVKSFAAHYAALAAAEEAHGRALQALAQGEAIRLPWLEQSLFVPHSGGEGSEGVQKNGWARVQARIKDGTAKDAEDRLELARTANADIVEPLKRLHTGIKGFIADLDQQLNTLAVDVVKERATSVERLKHLVSAVSTFATAPLTVPAAEDPVIVRSTAEAQMREQVARENELLRLTLLWQDKARDFEIELFDRVGACWKTWEEASAKSSSASEARASDIGKLVDALPNGAEWMHFSSLNYLVPSATPARDPELVDYPERDHPATKPIMEGVLERRKRVVKNWKEAYFVLSPAGYLHEYPSSSTPLSSPSVSLFLPNCTITPLTEPSLGSKRGKDKPASFSIEGRKSSLGGTVHGALGLQHRETGRSYRARSYATAQEWWSAISQLTKSAQTAHEGGAAHRAGPAALAVSQAGMPAFVQHEGAEMSAEEEGAAGEVTDEEREGDTVRGETPGTGAVAAAVGRGEASTTLQAAGEKEHERVPPQAAQTEEAQAAPVVAGASHRREPSMPGHFALEEEKSEAPISSTSQQVQPVGDVPSYTAPPAGVTLTPHEKQAPLPGPLASSSAAPPPLPPRAPAAEQPALLGTVEAAAPVMRDTPAAAPHPPLDPLPTVITGPLPPPSGTPVPSALLAPSSPIPPGQDEPEEQQMSLAVPAFLAAGQLPDPGAGPAPAQGALGRGAPPVQGTGQGPQPKEKERRRSSWLRFGKKDKK
ncbi:hypothetical protein JCM10450v2_003980 [Rhodotorula kratochvilovae]